MSRCVDVFCQLLADVNLGRSISKKLSINVNAGTENADLWRGIRTQMAALLDGLDPKDLATMSLGLSHSLSRYVLGVSKAYP